MTKDKSNNKKREKIIDQIKNYFKFKQDYPIYYTNFYLKWSFLNAFYNTYKKGKESEWNTIKTFSQVTETLYDFQYIEPIKEIIQLECVGDGRNKGKPNQDIISATSFLRKLFEVESDICESCSKREICVKNENSNIRTFEAILRILYQIRNNLFHGDKTEIYDYYGERNKSLVKLGNDVLTYVLRGLKESSNKILDETMEK